MLSWEMRSYEMASTEPGAVFFDRCIPELPGYLRLIGLPVPDHMKKAAENYRYSRGVFIFPPWPEIFTRDAERKQTRRKPNAHLTPWPRHTGIAAMI